MKSMLLFSLACVLSATASAQKLEPAIIETMGGEKIGYKNPAGQVIIKPRFEEANAFLNGYATVSIGGRWGMIDSTGREILPLKYRDLDYFAEGLAGASLDGKKYGFVNTKGTVVIPFTFDGVGSFSEGRATAIMGRKAALINESGSLLTTYKYQGIELMKGGIARVCLQNDSRDGVQYSHFWGFINAQGKEISKLNCLGVESPNLENGRAVTRIATPEGATTVQGQRYTFKVGQRYRYASALIDKTGRVVIPTSAGYEFGNWDEDYIIVQRGPAYGVVDMAGKVLLPVNFREITKFEFGADGQSLAKVFTTAEGKFFYVDRHFKCVEYDGVKCPEY